MRLSPMSHKISYLPQQANCAGICFRRAKPFTFSYKIIHVRSVVTDAIDQTIIFHLVEDWEVKIFQSFS